MSGKTNLRVGWATVKAARYACMHWHYSKSMPMAPYNSIGVWEGRRYVGAVLFSRSVTKHIVSPYGLDDGQGCELTRVALRNHSTPVTRILRIALRMVKARNPGLRLIVSFADPAQGHHGGIYQAGNWIYTGQTASSVSYRAPTGKLMHARCVNDKGVIYIHNKPRPCWRPDQCERVELPGKHRYLMPLDPEIAQRVKSLHRPYPRRDKHAMAVPTVQRRGSADRHAPPTPTEGLAHGQG